jgi:hypothetical protein
MHIIGFLIDLRVRSHSGHIIKHPLPSGDGNQVVILEASHDFDTPENFSDMELSNSWGLALNFVIIHS